MYRLGIFCASIALPCFVGFSSAWGGILDGGGSPDPTFAGNSMLLWLDAGAGVTTDGSGNVTAWADQSTYGNDASQSNTARQPLLVSSALNGRPAVVFSNTATSDWLDIPSGLTGQQTMLIVYQDTSTIPYSTPLGSSYIGGVGGSYHGAGNDDGLFSGSTVLATRNGQNFRNGILVGDGLTTPRPDDWALDVHVATIPLTQDIVTVGADQCCAPRSIDGGIAEVLLYDRALSPQELNEVGFYLETKYGLDTAYAGPRSGPVYDLAKQFNTVSNDPANAWYYVKIPGEDRNGTYPLLSPQASKGVGQGWATSYPGLWKNVTASAGPFFVNDSVPAGAVAGHPSANDGVGAVWTAPADGTVDIEGFVKLTETAPGADVEWHLDKGDAGGNLASGFLSNNTGPSTQSFWRAGVPVQQGDVILLSLMDGGALNSDNSQMSMTITFDGPQPEVPQMEVISLNFATGKSGSSYDLDYWQTAGVVPAAVWNNLHDPSGAQSGLHDAAGDVSTASVEWTSNGTWNTAIVPADGDTMMMKSHLDAQSPTDASVTVSNLPAAFTESGYDVYVYFDASTDTGVVFSGYTIGDQTYWTQDTSTFAGTYVQATGADKATATAGANYALFTGLTDSSFTLVADSDVFRAEVSGIQIVQIPEPSSALLALLGIGLIGLIGWRRTGHR